MAATCAMGPLQHPKSSPIKFDTRSPKSREQRSQQAKRWHRESDTFIQDHLTPLEPHTSIIEPILSEIDELASRIEQLRLSSYAPLVTILNIISETLWEGIFDRYILEV